MKKPPQEAKVVGQTEKRSEQISAGFEISDSRESETVKTEIVPNVQEETVDFGNSLAMLASLAYVIWCIVLVANAYAIAMLFLN